MQLSKAQRAASALAVGLQEARVHGVGEQRDVTEHVMEDVRLLQIIEFGLGTNERPGGKASVGEMLEEGVVGNKPRDGDDAPAGQSRKPFAQIRKIRDAGARKLQLRLRFEKGLAGAAGQQFGLPGEEPVPPIVLLGRVGGPILIDGPIRVAAGCGVPISDRRTTRASPCAPLLRGP